MAIYVKLKMIDVTMKKIYQNPETKIVKIQTQYQMLAGSPGYGGTTTETSGNLSRRGNSVWDEDDEEEY